MTGLAAGCAGQLDRLAICASNGRFGRGMWAITVLQPLTGLGSERVDAGHTLVVAEHPPRWPTSE